MSPDVPSPWRIARRDWLLLGVAIVVAHGFFARILEYPSSFDAANYLEIADDIESNGLFRSFPGSEIRTYGYPLFLALSVRLAVPRTLHFVDIFPDPGAWLNRCVARYYGLDSVRAPPSATAP